MKKKQGNVEQHNAQLALDLFYDEGKQPSASALDVAREHGAVPTTVVVTTVFAASQTSAVVTNLASVRSERVRDILIQDLIRTRVPAKQA